jgi:signal transduction histidine kinase
MYLSVIDFGIGIPDDNQRIIFDRFKRLDTGVNSLNRGHGLGLSINKAFIELLIGKIEVKSQKFKGSKFTLIIPESEQEVGDFAPDGNEIFFGDGVIL